MSPTLRQLRAFAEVARHASFSEAARHLHLTQSSVSGLLRELERQIGLALLDRTTRSVTLTAAGRAFLIHTQRILSDVEQAMAMAQGLLNKSHGHVAVAASPLAAATLLPDVIREFSVAYPEVTVTLHDVLTDQILHFVRDGTVDLGVGTFQRSQTELELVTLFEDRLGVMIAPGSVFADRRTLRWADLQDQTFIALSRSSAFRALIDSTFESQGVPVPPPRFEVGYMGTAVALVEAGLGISVLPQRAAELSRTGRSSWVPLVKPAVTRAATLVTRAGSTLSPAAEAFVSLLSKSPK